MWRLHNSGLLNDNPEAASWFQNVAETRTRNARAYFALTALYSAKPPRDGGGWAPLLEMAAEQGHASSLLMLGWAYGMGLGLSQDKAMAGMWFGRAAEQGDEIAKLQLDALAKESSPVPPA